MISSWNNLQCVRLGQSYDWEKLQSNSLRIVKLASKQMEMFWKYPGCIMELLCMSYWDSYAWVMERLYLAELVINFTGCIMEHTCVCVMEHPIKCWSHPLVGLMFSKRFLSIIKSFCTWSSKSKSVAGNLTLTSSFAHCTWPGTALPHQLILMLDQVSVILITVSSQYLWMVDLGIPVANWASP